MQYYMFWVIICYVAYDAKLTVMLYIMVENISKFWKAY